MTLLQQLQRATRRGILNVSALARAIEWNRDTLRKRLERGQPAFSPDEEALVLSALATDGISLHEQNDSAGHPRSRRGRHSA